MKTFKLADNTIDQKDYLKMISFLRARKHLTCQNYNNFERNFQNF